MDNDLFLHHYLKPSADGLDRRFTVPLPNIRGLTPCGEFIVQGHLEDTFSTNIITKFEDPTGLRLVEVYKNTENLKQGLFIRLVGTMSLVRLGYPVLFLDAAVSNLDVQTAQRSAVSTRVAIHLPQASPEQKEVFYAALNHGADAAGLIYACRELASLPSFWGPLWSVRAEGINFEMIKILRSIAWTAYNALCAQTRQQHAFDYRPVQEQMIFKNSLQEHHLFKKMGLSVPAEAQAAFFSVLVAGM